MTARRPRFLLVAGNAEAIDRVRPLLEPGAQVVAATSIDQAAPHLDAALDLIIGLDFPQTRMLDFLRQVKAAAGARRTPVTFIDLARLRHRHGVRDADQTIRSLVSWHAEASG